MQKLNGQLERWETIKKFIILPRDLTIEDGELTPSMKVRRKIVEQKYMSELDTLYTSNRRQRSRLARTAGSDVRAAARLDVGRRQACCTYWSNGNWKSP